MLQTIEVIVEPNGVIRPLEELHVETPTRGVLTLLETPGLPVEQPKRGSAEAILALLQTPRFANRPPTNPEEIDARIREEREAWD